MKKIIAVLLILCVIAAAFADDSSITFKGISAVDSRSPAMGGAHVADTSDYFTLLRNPAGLAFSGRHNLVGQTNINIGGPLEEIMNMASGGTDDLISAATDLIADNKLNLGFNLGGPIAFGGTYKNGFGWGVFEQVLVNAVAPSTVVKVDAELDVDATFGYGHDFSLGAFGDLAVGVSGDFYGQVPYVKVQKNLLSLLSGGDMSDQLSNAIVLSATTGLNINAGIEYKVLGFLSAGLVWNNFACFAKTSVPSTTGMDNLDTNELLAFDKSINEVGKGSLDIGVGIDIPTFWSLGIISDWTAYADMKDLAGMFKNDPLERNPILNLGLGTEMTVLKCISARLGISDSYLNAGIGVKLLAFHIDASIYGKELGTEPGSTPQLNCAISIGFRK